jgi:gamma-glutamyltranspeptidase/glutathione hydrolase
MRKILVVVLLIYSGMAVSMSSIGRPPAAAIASAHPLATQAGFEILAAGGNAFDAAIAVTAVLAVVEPYSSGIGGGGFWLLYRASDGKRVMIDGRERAPLKAHRDMYVGSDGKVVPGLSINGPLSAGIPGEPAALVHLAKKYGRLPLSRSLAPAIRIARQGFRVDAYYRRMARFRLEVLRRSPEAARILLMKGDVPPLGYVIRQPELANTLEALARHGHKGFYRGPVAKALVRGVQKSGGIWTLKDLASYRVIERKPIIGRYRGMKVISAAPPSSGGIVLVQMLNILSAFRIEIPAQTWQLHLVVEAMRRAYRDRAQYLGDPDFVKIPTRRLLSKAHARQWRKGIHKDHATPSSSLPPVSVSNSRGRDTTHFSIIDRDGNRVAATLSINYPFGSCFIAPGTGVILNDEMDDFSSKPGTPNVYGLVGNEANAIAPGKRPLSSMSPTFVESKHAVMVIGTPGGSRIISMVLLGVLGHSSGLTAKDIVAWPRFHHQYLPDVIQFEPGAFSKLQQSILKNMGHKLKLLAGRYGNMHVVIWNKLKNRVTAASDPRGVGSAEVRE